MSASPQVKAILLAGNYLKTNPTGPVTADTIYDAVSADTTLTRAEFRDVLRLARSASPTAGVFALGSAGDYPPGLAAFLAVAEAEGASFEAVTIAGMTYLNSANAAVELMSPENAEAFFNSISKSNGSILLHYIEMHKRGLKARNQTLFAAAMAKAS